MSRRWQSAVTDRGASMNFLRACDGPNCGTVAPELDAGGWIKCERIAGLLNDGWVWRDFCSTVCAAAFFSELPA